MKAKISKWGEALLSNPKNSSSLVKAIIEQGPDAMRGNGIIEFDVYLGEDPQTKTTETIRILSAGNNSDNT
jgi:hypothetical protein